MTKKKKIFLSEFWGLIHAAQENGEEPPFSEESISFVEETLMEEPILTDAARAILYYLQIKEKENNNFTLASDCARFLHTTGYSLIPSFKILARYGLITHSYVGHDEISGYSLTDKGRKFEPLGKTKNINDIILSIID